MKKIYLLISFLVLLSCSEREMNFVKLEKHSGESVYDFDGNDTLNGKKFVYETYLVENKLGDKSKLENKLLNFNEETYIKKLKEKGYVSYFIDFYVSNSTTEYFIDHNEDPGGFSSYILSDNFDEDGIAKVYIDKINSSKCIRKIRFSDEEEFRTIDTISFN